MIWLNKAWFMLALVPAVLYLLRRRNRADHHYADEALKPWALFEADGARGWTSDYLSLLLTTVLFLFLAASLAGPHVPIDVSVERGNVGVPSASETTIQVSQDAVIMVLLDVSRHMDKTDVKPQRSQRALLELQDWFTQLHGEKVGFMVFAGESQLVTPPTWDVETLKWYLPYLNQNLSQASGSRVDLALNEARQRLLLRQEKVKAILLLTAGSGLNTHGAPALQAASALKKVDVGLFVLGLLGEKQAENGLLGVLADRAEGLFVPVQQGDNDWQSLYEQGIRHFISERLTPPQGSEELLQWAIRPVFHWFVWAALVMLVVNVLYVRQILPRLRGGIFTVLGVLFVSGAPDLAEADFSQRGKEESGSKQAAYNHADAYRQAWEKWRTKQFSQSAQLFSTAGGYQGLMGEGASLYRQEVYLEASQIFQQATLLAQTDEQRADSLFNKGNAHFQAQQYVLAVDAYRGAKVHASGIDDVPSTPYQLQRLKRISGNLEKARAALPKDSEVDMSKVNRTARQGDWLQGVVDVDNVFVPFEFGLLDDETLARLKEQQDALSLRISNGDLRGLQAVSSSALSASELASQKWDQLGAEKKLGQLHNDSQTLIQAVLIDEKQAVSGQRLGQ